MDVSLRQYREGRWNEPLHVADLAIVFAAPSFGDQPEVFAQIDAKAMIGCSTSGEIFGRRVEDDTVSVALIRFDRASARFASAGIAEHEDERAASLEIADALEGETLRAVFVLTDGLEVNGSAIAEALSDALPDGVVVTGGLAGDGDRFERTWVLDEGTPRSGVISAVGLYGDGLRLSHGSRGGWDIFGPRREITRAEGTVLYELDGRPALDLYKEYLGERAAGLPSTGLLFPLEIRVDQEDEGTVRTILGIDEEERSLTFAGTMPVGASAQLMRANFDRLVEGAEDAAEMCDTDAPVLALAISCVGRRLVLGARTEDELDAAAESLAEGSHLIGFYSYGELSPLTSGRCALHNQTMTLTTLREVREG